MPFINSLPLHLWTGSKKVSPVTPRAHVDTSNIPKSFGVPNTSDDDPFGVFALEEAGLQIKEAGTKSRPQSETFEYRPSPTSPLFPAYRRSLQNLERISWEQHRESRRNSRRSNKSVDMSTQTSTASPSFIEEPAPLYHSPLRQDSGRSDSPVSPVTPATPSAEEWERKHDLPRRMIRNSIFSVKEEEEEVLEEEPEIIIEDIQGVHIVSHACTSPVSAIHPKLVNIPKRPAPIVPARNPMRIRAPKQVLAEEVETQEVDFADDTSSVYSNSPTRSGFDSQGPPSPNPWSEETSLGDDESIRRKIDDDDFERPAYTDSAVQMDAEQSSKEEIVLDLPSQTGKAVKADDAVPSQLQEAQSSEHTAEVQFEDVKTEEESLEKMTEGVNHALAEKIPSPKLRPVIQDFLKTDTITDDCDMKDDASVYDDEIPTLKDDDEFHSAQPSRTQTPFYPAAEGSSTEATATHI